MTTVAGVDWFYVVNGRRDCGHKHRSTQELALCWRGKGQLWQRYHDGTHERCARGPWLASLKALVPRPVRGRPPSEKPRIAQASPLHVKGIPAADMALYDRMWRHRGFRSMSHYVRESLARDAVQFRAECRLAEREGRPPLGEEVATEENSGE
jgi:hypothetical protein